MEYNYSDNTTNRIGNKIIKTTISVYKKVFLQEFSQASIQN